MTGGAATSVIGRARALASTTLRAVAHDRGAVAAEFAVALPAVVLVVLLTSAALGACATQVRLQDAAADAARLASRGEDPGRIAQPVAAIGGTVAVGARGDLVCVTATAEAGIIPVTLTASSCALDGGR
ncbi:TadE family type IV pilus minor pilin [Microbacterium sp. 1P10UB]|uniref:TadE family type IV pilus minor pilin n=1 Tax=unclassified Microbacterium TaxID=2609290 RepID=UPI0039A0B083